MRKLDACSTHCSSPGGDHVASFHTALRHGCDKLEFLAKAVMSNPAADFYGLTTVSDHIPAQVSDSGNYSRSPPRGNNHHCVEKQGLTKSSQYHLRHLAARSRSNIFLPVALRLASGLRLSTHGCSRTSVSPIHSSVDIGKR